MDTSVKHGINFPMELADRITSALSAPSPSSVELVEQIREHYIHHPEAYDDYAVANFTLSDSEAAALIDQCRTVPYDLMYALLKRYWPMGSDAQYKQVIKEYAARYGYTVKE